MAGSTKSAKALRENDKKNAKNKKRSLAADPKAKGEAEKSALYHGKKPKKKK
jgi:hypothetical protein